MRVFWICLSTIVVLTSAGFTDTLGTCATKRGDLVAEKCIAGVVHAATCNTPCDITEPVVQLKCYHGTKFPAHHGPCEAGGGIHDCCTDVSVTVYFCACVCEICPGSPSRSTVENCKGTCTPSGSIASGKNLGQCMQNNPGVGDDVCQDAPE